jgi:hypothetical protein
VNFATRDWFEFGLKARVCICSSSAFRPDVAAMMRRYDADPLTARRGCGSSTSVVHPSTSESQLADSGRRGDARAASCNRAAATRDGEADGDCSIAGGDAGASSLIDKSCQPHGTGSAASALTASAPSRQCGASAASGGVDADTDADADAGGDSTALDPELLRPPRGVGGGGWCKVVKAKLLVLWGNTWYDATVAAVDENWIRVHYKVRALCS